MPKTIAVIGAGVAATSVIYWLKKLRPLDKIVQFSCENLAPAASLNSTAVAALRGTRAGLSALGDELCAHWEFSDAFYGTLSLPGLEESELETWLYEEKDLRRFAHLTSSTPARLKALKAPLKVVREKCWMIEPQAFLASFDQSHEHHQELVCEVHTQASGWRLRTQAREVEVQALIICTGVWQRWMKDFYPASELESLRAVQGSFYQWQGVDLGQESFALSVHGVNLHYRAQEQSLQLGATSIKDADHFRLDTQALTQLFQLFSSHVELKVDPAQAQIHTGIRSILKTRRPWAGELAENLYALNGLYKNGWVSAWPLGKAVVEQLRMP